MNKILVQIFLIIILSSSLGALALESKSLYLSKDNIYLLLFDDKVEEFEASKKDVIKISLMTTIFNDKHQVIIQPKKNEDVNIIFWTQNEVFNFDVFVGKENKTEKIINISSAQKQELENISKEIGEEIDLPFGIDTSFDGFEIDKPPVLKESK